MKNVEAWLPSEVSLNKNSMLEKNLETYFHFSKFRTGQREIIESILGGSDIVALMPTGGGKSLCYQLPAILSEKVTLIISPLIALMKDQVDSLMARGIAATFINSSLPLDEMNRRMMAIREGKIKIVYVAPERFAMWVSGNYCPRSMSLCLRWTKRTASRSGGMIFGRTTWSSGRILNC